ncbi:hypothetical protein [Neobacillus niacini]|uniref:hypothetical protein n=1 Tax=Neobacillus niacini TaxID=86668 RepID=UPI00285A0482|nr:hypothetical protein [Neobacillus niacini]MDR7002047.1 hypothetical protein [Neobacillus niacini]
MKKTALTVAALSIGILLGACSHDTTIDDTIDSFGKKINSMQEFSAVSEYKTAAYDRTNKEIHRLSSNSTLNTMVNFKNKEGYVKSISSKNTEHIDPNSVMYIKDKMMYLKSYDSWLAHPVLDKEFSETLKINDLASVYSQLQQNKKYLEYEKSGKRIILQTKKQTNPSLNNKEISSIYGPISDSGKAKVKSYSLKLILDSRTYFPVSLERNISVSINNVTYKNKIVTHYQQFKNVNIKIPKVAYDTPRYE